MRRFFAITQSSFRLAMLELWKNKLRSFLSLFGITIGIFCIIGVLATVNSLQINLQTQINSLGTNTIYIDKWLYSAGPNQAYWKYVNRPAPRYVELREIMARTPTARTAAFKINTSGDVEGGSSLVKRVRIYGISENFAFIQPLDVQYGRFFTPAEFSRGTNTVLIGAILSQNLFGSEAAALRQKVLVRGEEATIIGVVKKQGSQVIGGWGFDEAVITTYQYARTLMNEYKADPLVLVQGKKGIDSKALQDDLTGSLRAIRKLRPAEEDNFALNDVADLSAVMSQAFVSVNLGGWIIGALSFIVGIFGVANIMFVTVKERTAQIGLKKALGATSRVILTEFLLESAFLCLVGGFIGLVFVYILTRVATALFQFPFFLSPGIIATAVIICMAAGVLAGIIPASRAARLDPVVAIRS